MLDGLATLESPDVDLLRGELLATRGFAEEFAYVLAVHDDTGHDLVAVGDLVLDLKVHRSPELTQPPDGLDQALRPLRVRGWRLVVDEVRMNQLVRRLEVALLEELLEKSPGRLLVLL